MSPSNYSASGEYLFVEVNIKGVKAILGVVYCPPSVNYFNSLEIALDSIGSEYTHFLIMGDFNTDLLKVTHRSQKLRSLFESVNLDILPLRATHHNIDTEDTWIDLIITDSQDHVKTYGQLLAPGFSRHDLVYMTYKLNTHKNRPKMANIRNFSKVDHEKLLQDASNIEIHSVLSATTMDDKVSLLNKAILKLFDTHAPIRKVRLKRPPAPWMTNGVQMARRKRDRAFRTFKKDRTSDNWQVFKKARNRCNQMIRIAKRRFIHNNIINSSSADVWKFLNSYGVGKHPTVSIPPSLSLDEINLHFCSGTFLDITVRDQTISLINLIQFPDLPIFRLTVVSHNIIRKFILSIKSKAMGIDQINRTMIILTLDSLLPIISHVINFSLETGQYPLTWKKAIVRPLPKIPNPILPNHYRPISILPFLSKILEACVHRQLSDFIRKHDLLCTYQSGFRPGHSTTTALIKVVDDIRSAMDSRKITIMVLVDFSNAFNTVDHNILISILARLKFCPTTLKWFDTYLRDRQQSINHENMSSKWLCLDSGVPQGGILSPLLFSLFINSLTSVINCPYHLYADDFQLYVTTDLENLHNAIIRVNANLEAIHNWSLSYGVSVNASKCQSILVGSSKLLAKVDVSKISPVYYDGCVIPLSTSVKNLGLHIDNTLNWRVHVHEINRKVVNALRPLYRLKNFLPFKTKLLLINTLILPLIDYADVCCSDLTEELLNKLERLLNNCIRFIFNLRKYDHISQYRSQLKWLTIRQRRDSRILLALYSILNNPASPIYLKEQFQFLSSSHERQLRSSHNHMLLTPIHESGFFNKSFTVRTIQLWNALPENIKKVGSKFKFKRLVQQHYRSKSE